MRYAETQLTRPQVEDGCDYGCGRRSVLVRNGEKELLHVAGHKFFGGVGHRAYAPARIVLWDPSRRDGTRQIELHEGRLPPARLSPFAEAIWKHLGEKFDIELIAMDRTLLLDEPGENTEPPRNDKPRAARRPRFAAEYLYRIVSHPDDPAKLRLLQYRVAKATGSHVTAKHPRSQLNIKLAVDQLARHGFYSDPREARDAHARIYEERVASAIQSLETALAQV